MKIAIGISYGCYALMYYRCVYMVPTVGMVIARKKINMVKTTTFLCVTDCAAKCKDGLKMHQGKMVKGRSM